MMDIRRRHLFWSHRSDCVPAVWGVRCRLASLGGIEALARRLSFVGFATLNFCLAPATFAHGTHSWFESPADGETVRSTVSVVMKTIRTPKNKYVHMQIVRLDNNETMWQDLVEKTTNQFATKVNVASWRPGQYRVEAVLVGEVFPHPKSRVFTVVNSDGIARVLP